MLLNALSNEKEINFITEATLNKEANTPEFRKAYIKATLKSLGQGALVGFATLGVIAVTSAIIAIASADGVIEE